MALFGLFGSQKKASAKKAVEMTAGVFNTGVDIYSFRGTPEEYFTYILNRNFYNCEIRRNVAFADIYDPIGEVRAAARNPASAFRTQFHKTVAYDMLRGSYPRLTFVIYRNGQPEIAVLLCPKADYDNGDKRLAMNRMGLALRQKNIAFQRYFEEFRNDEAYVRERIQEDLGW